MTGRQDKQVACGECSRPCRMTTGAEIYPRRADLAEKVMWRCDGCGAYIGCHDGTTTPLGSPTGRETRTARMQAHAAFDVLWARKVRREGISKCKARGAAYKWLADQLQIDPAQCHIGMMDAATAKRVADLCLPFSQPKGARP